MKHLKNNLKDRKRVQKSSVVLRSLSGLIQRLSMDEPSLFKVFITKVTFSSDYKICYVYFSTFQDKSDFEPALEMLKLYKPSLKNALAKEVGGRYTSDLFFMYDDAKDKERRVTKLLEKVSEEIKKEDDLESEL